jgi:hypothetical protein
VTRRGWEWDGTWRGRDWERNPFFAGEIPWRSGPLVFQARRHGNVARALFSVALVSLPDRFQAVTRQELQNPVAAGLDGARGQPPHSARDLASVNRPILEALEALDGSAPMSRVLDRVLQSMKGVLRDVDDDTDEGDHKVAPEPFRRIRVAGLRPSCPV